MECKEKVYFFRSGHYAMFFWLAHHECFSNRWKVDQFVVVWLGIVVIIIFSGVRVRIGAAIL